MRCYSMKLLLAVAAGLCALWIVYAVALLDAADAATPTCSGITVAACMDAVYASGAPSIDVQTSDPGTPLTAADVPGGGGMVRVTIPWGATAPAVPVPNYILLWANSSGYPTADGSPSGACATESIACWEAWQAAAQVIDPNATNQYADVNFASAQYEGNQPWLTGSYTWQSSGGSGAQQRSGGALFDLSGLADDISSALAPNVATVLVVVGLVIALAIAIRFVRKGVKV